MVAHSDHITLELIFLHHLPSTPKLHFALLIFIIPHHWPHKKKTKETPHHVKEMPPHHNIPRTS